MQILIELGYCTTLWSFFFFNIQTLSLNVFTIPAGSTLAATFINSVQFCLKIADKTLKDTDKQIKGEKEIIRKL